MTKVSVVIPCYKFDTTLCQRAIKSILQQSLSDIELLIIDDSPNDNTEFFSEFEDNRIKYIHNYPRIGLATSKNQGMKFATCDYIAFMDVDDYSYPERLQKQYQFLLKHPDVDICGTWFKAGQNNIKHPTDNKDISFGMLFSHCCLGMPTIMLRKTSLVKLSMEFPSLSSIEDYDLWLSLLGKAKFANIPEILFDYNLNENSLSTQKGLLISQSSSASRERKQKELLGFSIEWTQKEEFTTADWALFSQERKLIQKHFGSTDFSEKFFAHMQRNIIRRTVRNYDFYKELWKENIPFLFKLKQFFKRRKVK